jgi:pimeloyl-ACP methyl ester carboxylesterase
MRCWARQRGGSMDWCETSAEVERARAEIPVIIRGPDGALFGIFTPPAPEAPSAGLCVVMPALTRWHFGRMPVKSARALAASGFACLRFDYHGYGESEGVTTIITRSDTFGADVVAAIRYLRQSHGQKRFVLSGYCFDALSSLAAFIDEADAIEGLVFMAAPILKEREASWDRRYVLRALANPTKVRNSFRSWRDGTRKAAKAAQALGRSLTAGAEQRPFGLPETFEEHFRALVRSHARALILYGEDDALYREFQIAEPYLFANLAPEPRRRFEVEVWPGLVHPPQDVQRQQEIFERAQSWIEALHPRRGDMLDSALSNNVSPEVQETRDHASGSSKS